MNPSEKKIRKTDIVLVLRPKDGTKPKSSTGLTDSRLFTGENTLHLKYNHQQQLWEFEYENGMLPEPLKQKFTAFNIALNFITGYYERRNVQIAEIKD